MKNSGLFCLLLTCIALGSCKNNQSENGGEGSQVKAEKPISVTTYRAVYEQDTIDLKVNTLKSGKITGDMEMKILICQKKQEK
ncbi:hypothetical protein AB3G33_10350 [Flavobacterium sp. WC2421]|uniref:hypothetical protein n=1 Tax=Flavobacterium sp. WC2421 TaxID=3234138 RepID=UPI003467A7E4